MLTKTPVGWLRDGWPKSNSRNGQRQAKCGIPRTSVCARTSGRKTWSVRRSRCASPEPGVPSHEKKTAACERRRFFAHRAFHALPKTIRRRGNKGAGAILGFANFLLRPYESEKPRAVLVGWDTLDKPTYRHEALESYQSGREFDDELAEQLDILPEFVAACGFASAKSAGYEANDFLAAAVAREDRRRGTTVVATGDRDAYQLASETTTILQPIRAGEMTRIGPAEVRKRYGVEPTQVPDFIAIRGDASDRIPGAAGIGPVGAAALLRKFGSLENAIAAGRLANQADMGQGRRPGPRLAAQPARRSHGSSSASLAWCRLTQPR